MSYIPTLQISLKHYHSERYALLFHYVDWILQAPLQSLAFSIHDHLESDYESEIINKGILAALTGKLLEHGSSWLSIIPLA